MLSTRTISGLLIDISTFLVHLLVAIGFALLAVLIQAPLFGVRPELLEVVQASVFFVLAVSIFVVDISLIINRTFMMHLVIFCITLFSALVWSFWISSYDMIYFIIAYLIITVPILVIKYWMIWSTT